MSVNDKQEYQKSRIRDLEMEISKMKLELEDAHFQLKLESEKHLYYQLIADFTFGWELWFEPNANIKYCSPSCYDLTGFTSNQIVNSSGISELVVYQVDKSKFIEFLKGALNQELVNQSLEFRILTRTKQLRWCLMSVRGVYDKKGKYLGIRASVQDVTRLKRAMGHIQELEKTKEFELRTKQRLKTELELKDRELVSFLLQLSQKNELINKTTRLLELGLSSDSKKLKENISKVHALLKGGTINQFDWGVVESQVEKSHPGFLGRLQAKHITISEKDKKLCAYIRLGLSSKEISGLMNITPKSVEIARVRLRRKLEIPSKIRLPKYLSII